MDFVNKTIKQLTDLFASMTPAARVTSALLVVAIGLSLFFLFQFQTSLGDVYIYGGREFSQDEIGAMENALSQEGLQDYTVEGYKIKVPRNQLATYLAAIADGGAGPKGVADLNASTSFNPLMTDAQQQQEKEIANELKVAKMLTTDEVNEVAVEYGETKEDGLGRKTIRTAVVSARAKGGRELTSREINMLREGTRRGFPGLRVEDITVLDRGTGKHHEMLPGESESDPAQNVYARTKIHHEQELRTKILNTLAHMQVSNVEVSVELDKTINSEEATKELKNPVTISSETEKVTETNTKNDAGGRPGTVPNTAVANGASTVASSGGTQSNSQETLEKAESVVGGSIVSLKKAGLTPQKASVSVGVPESYYKTIWAKRNPVAAGGQPKEMTYNDFTTLQSEVETEITNRIYPLLPDTQSGVDRRDYIVVRTDFDPPAVAPAAADTMAGVLAWLSTNWPTFGMIFLGLFGLMMMRSMVNSAMASSAAVNNAPTLAESKSNAGGGAATETEEEKARRSFEAAGPNLRDELADLVDSDPEAAAKVLRQWIGEAA